MSRIFSAHVCLIAGRAILITTLKHDLPWGCLSRNLSQCHKPPLLGNHDAGGNRSCGDERYTQAGAIRPTAGAESGGSQGTCLGPNLHGRFGVLPHAFRRRLCPLQPMRFPLQSTWSMNVPANTWGVPTNVAGASGPHSQ